MAEAPLYPQFKPVSLEDRGILGPRLWNYQPETSELTFTNLFIWQPHYGFHWSMFRDWVLVVALRDPLDAWALQPVGPPPRADVARLVLRWLAQQGSMAPRIERADRWFLQEVLPEGDFQREPQREHFDYVYFTRALVELSGNDYHAKRNHLNAFRQAYPSRYVPLTSHHARACLEVAEDWCAGRCEDDMGLLGEWEALVRALVHFDALALQGGLIAVQGEVRAFALGELLNARTAVIHIEKADPSIRGLYAAINQQFLEHAWAETTFVNREQDLGQPGLRKAKESYRPVRLVEKYRVWLAS